MAYDEALADRIRRALEGRTDVEERRMFGGVAFMLRNHMCCGVVESRLMVRLDPDTTEPLLRLPDVAPMDFTGRPMRGFLFVGGEALDGDEELREWLDRAVAFAESIPEEPIGIEDEPIVSEGDGEDEERPVRRPAAKRVAQAVKRPAATPAAKRAPAKRVARKVVAKRVAGRVAKRAVKKTVAKQAARRVAKRAVKKKVAKRAVRRVAKRAAKRAARKAVAKRAVRRAGRSRARKRR